MSILHFKKGERTKIKLLANLLLMLQLASFKLQLISKITELSKVSRTLFKILSNFCITILDPLLRADRQRKAGRLAKT